MIEHVTRENYASPHPTIQHDQKFVNQRKNYWIEKLGKLELPVKRKSKNGVHGHGGTPPNGTASWTCRFTNLPN